MSKTITIRIDDSQREELMRAVAEESEQTGYKISVNQWILSAIREKISNPNIVK